MRPFLILFLTLLLSQMTFAQFFVVKVNGEVYADDQLLTPRVRLSSEAELRFSSSSAYAHVLSTSKGHFVLSGEKAKKNQKGEFLTALKEAIMPSDQFQAAATRAGSLGNDQVVRFEDKYDMKAYFRETLVLLDTAFFELNPENFPIDADRYFCLMHQMEDTVIARQLKVDQSSFFLAASDFQYEEQEHTGIEIHSSMLTYVDKLKNKNLDFGPFTMNFLNEEEEKMIREELNGMWQFLSPDSKPEFLQLHALPFMYSYYGKISVADIKKLME